jgi:hypothetical protein
MKDHLKNLSAIFHVFKDETPLPFATDRAKKMLATPVRNGMVVAALWVVRVRGPYYCCTVN